MGGCISFVSSVCRERPLLLLSYTRRKAVETVEAVEAMEAM